MVGVSRVTMRGRAYKVRSHFFFIFILLLLIATRQGNHHLLHMKRETELLRIHAQFRERLLFDAATTIYYP